MIFVLMYGLAGRLGYNIGRNDGGETAGYLQQRRVETRRYNMCRANGS